MLIQPLQIGWTYHTLFNYYAYQLSLFRNFSHTFQYANTYAIILVPIFRITLVFNCDVRSMFEFCRAYQMLSIRRLWFLELKKFKKKKTPIEFKLFSLYQHECLQCCVKNNHIRYEKMPSLHNISFQHFFTSVHTTSTYNLHPTYVLIGSSVNDKTGGGDFKNKINIFLSLRFALNVMFSAEL